MTNALIIILLLTIAALAAAAYIRLGEIHDTLQRGNDNINALTYAVKEIRNEHRDFRPRLHSAVTDLGDSLRQTREDMNQGTATIIQLFATIKDDDNKTNPEPTPAEPDPEPTPEQPSEEPEPAPNEEHEPVNPE